MTAQDPEILHHRNKSILMMGTPLYRYISRLPKKRRPDFRYGSTTNWRGYVGTWEIIGKQLFLVSIEGDVLRDGALFQADLQTLFPKARGPVVANWVSGEFRCVEGRELMYVHSGFSSLFERDRLLTFEKGILVSEFVVLNPPPPVFYEIADDGARTCRNGPFAHADAEPDPLGGKPFEAVYEEVWSKQPDDFME